MKTARFAEVVEKSGKPETYLLWVPAPQDKAFQRALKDHRIMTVHQELRGAKKDFGIVGFHEEPNAQFLLFPKSLRRFEGRRVIGINYELFAKTTSAQSKKVSVPERKQPAAKPKKEVAVAAKNEKRGENVVEFAPAPAAAEVKPKEKSPPPAKKTEPPSAPPLPKKKEVPKEESGDSNQRIESVAKLPAAVVRELEKVLKELRAGKSVVAYERLEAVVKGARGAKEK